MDCAQTVDGGYAWVILFSSFCLNYLAAGLYLAHSVLLVEFSEVFNQPKSVTSWGGSINAGVTAFSGFLFGYLAEEYGARLVTVVCGILLSAALLLTSQAPNIYVVYVTYGLIGGLGLGGIYLTSVVVMQHYFDKRRPLAAGIALTGGSVASITFSPLFRLLVAHYGWREAMIIHSGIALQAVVLGATYRPLHQPKQCPCIARNLYMSSDEEYSKQILDGSERSKKSNFTQEGKHNIILLYCSLLKDPVFLIFLLAQALLYYSIIAMYQYLPIRAVFMGIDKMQAALIPSAIGLSATGFRFVSSAVANIRYTNRNMYFAMTCLGAGIIVGLSCVTGSFIEMMICAGLYGAFYGQFMTLQPTVMVDIVGKDNVEIAQGLRQTLLGFTSLSALPCLGWLFDITHNYHLTFIVAGTLQVISGLCMLIVFILCKIREVRSEKQTETT